MVIGAPVSVVGQRAGGAKLDVAVKLRTGIVGDRREPVGCRNGGAIRVGDEAAVDHIAITVLVAAGQHDGRCRTVTPNHAGATVVDRYERVVVRPLRIDVDRTGALALGLDCAAVTDVDGTSIALAADRTHEYIAASGGPETSATAHALRKDGVRILARGDDRTAIGDDDIAARTIARGVALAEKVVRKQLRRGRRRKVAAEDAAATDALCQHAVGAIAGSADGASECEVNVAADTGHHRLIEGAAVFLAKTNDPAATTADALCKHAIRIESTRTHAAACGCVDGDRATAAARIEPIAARNGSADFAGIFLGRAGIAAHSHAIEAARGVGQRVGAAGGEASGCSLRLHDHHVAAATADALRDDADRIVA